MRAERQFTVRGSRGTQPVWVWLMVLTANEGMCVYCNDVRAQTLEHERPVADKGHDIWWNLLPACDRCNGWKLKRTAAQWVVDMKLQLDRPELQFTKNTLPRCTINGIMDRVTRVRSEIQDSDRCRWFKHHYGDEPRPPRRSETLELVHQCSQQISRYPHKPWTTPESPNSSGRFCSRRMCCPELHPDAQHETLLIAEKEFHMFHVAAYQERLHPGDLLGNLVRRYLAERASA